MDKTTMHSTAHTKNKYSPYISYEVMLIQVILPSSFDSTVSGMHSMTKPPTMAPCCRIQRSYWPASMVSSQTGFTAGKNPTRCINVADLCAHRISRKPNILNMPLPCQWAMNLVDVS